MILRFPYFPLPIVPFSSSPHRSSLSYLRLISLIFVDVRSIGNHLLLTHARAVDIYRRNYQSTQNGQIGITLVRDPAHGLFVLFPQHVLARHSYSLEYRMDGAD
jgi:hypothetical protein